MAVSKRPTTKQIEDALDVLLWLFENGVGSGADRDEISHVRYMLESVMD